MVERRSEVGKGAESGEGAAQGETDQPSDSAPRLVYSPPKLRHLGSVRELTLGTGMNVSDADIATNHN